MGNITYKSPMHCPDTYTKSMSSVESQKGINVERCSLDNQKGAITVQSMAIAPFWFSTEDHWTELKPFWLSPDDVWPKKVNWMERSLLTTSGLNFKILCICTACNYEWHHLWLVVYCSNHCGFKILSKLEISKPWVHLHEAQLQDNL